jgi:hypothetical protein
MKPGVTSRKGLAPATEVLKNIHREDWGADMPEWVSAWIYAESLANRVRNNDQRGHCNTIIH